MSNHNEHNDIQPVEEALHDLFQTAEPQDGFVSSLEKRILATPRSKVRPLWKERLHGLFVFARPVAAWGTLAFLLVIGVIYGRGALPKPLVSSPADPTTLALVAPTETLTTPPVFAPRPTPARNVAYLPDADFVNVDEVRILEIPVVQYHQEKGVVVSQVVGWDDRTEVWIERQGDWYNLEGAWLELEDGSRLELRYWNDAANSRQAYKSYLQFPAMPAGSTQAVLHLPDGWRVPIALIAPTAVAAANMAVVETPTEPCIQTPDVHLCVLGAVYDLNGAHILVNAHSQQPGMGVSIPIDTDPPLLDLGEAGIRKAIYDPFGAPYGAPQPTAQEAQYTLDFRPYENGAGLAKLTLPTVLLRAPVGQTISIALGPDLQDGQNWEVNLPIEVAGQTLIINRAEVVRSFTGGLQLWLFSERVVEKDGRSIVSLELGSTQPALDSYSYGYNQFTHQHEFVFELTHANGEVVRDQLSFTVESAYLRLSGPFEFQVDLIAGEQLASASTRMVEVTGFTPPPSPTPLPMAAFMYYDRPLQSGEALFVELSGERSNLYAMPVNPAQAAQLVASLPGKVYDVKVLPSGEVIYLAGEANENGFIRQARWFRWNVSHTAPSEIHGPVSYLSSIKWSTDGLYAYYETVENLSGSPTRRWIFNVNSATPSLVPVPQGVHIFGAIWSPQGEKLALSGYDENTSGQNDIYWLDLASASPQPDLVNLTGTPNLTEQALAWSADASQVLYQVEVDTNIYALQKINLASGEITHLGELPFYTYAPLLAGDGSSLALAGSKAGEGPSLYHLDLNNGELNHLTTGASFANLSYSPDGMWLSFVGGNATVQAVDLISENIWILRSLSSEAMNAGSRITWTGWAP